MGRGRVGRTSGWRRPALAAGLATAALLAPAAAAHGAGGVQSTLSAWTRKNPATSALVWRLEPGGGTSAVASIRPDTPRTPASTMKLVTSAGALLQLGTDFRFRTHLSTDAPVRGSALLGPVYLRGAGDPVLATRAYARRYLAGRATALSELARPLRGLGIRRVRGPIVADEHLFDARRMGPGWPSYYRLYAPPLSALATNQNYAGNGRTAHVALPAQAAAQRLKVALRDAGVAQAGPLRVGSAPPGGRLLATATSPPLPTILRAMNLESDNFIAETLAKDVGAYGSGEGTTRAGVARTGSLLRAHGILTAGDRLVDGSGLSRDNRLTAASLVRLITAASADPSWGAALISSLAQGGEGTLVHRLRAAPVRARVRAKTGYLNGVSAIAGRVVSTRGQPYAFAMLMSTRNITGAKATQDRVISLLASGAEDAGG